ncbi:MAG: nicotinamide-nucleotide adenylyltransferase [Thermoproteota archaeon]|nr:nicotinamide-nucleotide adenylyltransferase [Thermoproteota archaeon]
MTARFKRGLYVGRFQPFHRGHSEVVKGLLKKVDELVVVIGSSQKSHELENPFTSGERIEMIRASLDEIGVSPSKHYLIPVPDSQDHSLWVPQVVSSSPFFDVVYSNEPFTRRLFKEAHFTVESIPFFKREIYSATEVRKRMMADEDWRALLPKSVSEIIDRIGGVERLRELEMTDSPLKRVLRNKRK